MHQLKIRSLEIALEKLKYHEKVCKNKGFSETVLSSEKDNILEFNQYKLYTSFMLILNL